MTTYQQLVDKLLEKGTISDSEVEQLCTFVYSGHKPNLDDVRALTEVYVGLRQHSAVFEKFYFGTLKKIILEDGEIQPAEQFYLLKMLYSDREVRPVEIEFLRELKREARATTPEFDALFSQSLQVIGTTWDYGGTNSSSPNSSMMS